MYNMVLLPALPQVNPVTFDQRVCGSSTLKCFAELSILILTPSLLASACLGTFGASLSTF